MDLETRRTQEFTALQSSVSPISKIKDIGIGVKLSIAFGILIFLSLILGVSGLITAKLEEAALDRFLMAEGQVHVVEEFQSELSAMRDFEREFLLQHPVEGASAASAQLVATNQSHAQTMLTLINQIRTTILNETSNRQVELGQLNRLEQAVREYQTVFDTLVERIHHRGASNHGHIQHIIANIDALTVAANAVNAVEVETVSFEALAAFLKYLDTPMQEQRDDVQAVLNAVAAKIEDGNQVPSEQQKQLLALVNDIRQSYEALLALDDEIAEQRAKLNLSGDLIKSEADSIVAAREALAGQTTIRLGAMERQAQLLDLTLLATALVVGIALAYIVTHSIADPITHLTAVAERVAYGDFTVQANLTSRDEIGWLAATFNSMIVQLHDSLAGLEQRVQERMRALETSAAISRQLTTILDLDELLKYIVSAVKNAFGYYHVHIYLVNPNTGELIMREGTGEVAQQLKAKGHKLQAGQGIVGKTAIKGEAILVENVDEFPGFIRNPLLPDTRAELAVPLRKGETILGVLDVQSEEVGGFNRDDLILMRSIADQVVVAFENAHLFEHSQAAIAEVETLYRRLTRETWHDIGSIVDTSGYVFTKLDVTPSSDEWLPAMTEAVHKKELYSLAEDGAHGQNQATSIAIPLILRGEVIGAIGIERETPASKNGKEPEAQANARLWSEDELVTVRAVAEQVSLALDAARLNRDTVRAAWRDQMVSESTAKIWSSSEVDEVMKAAVTQLGDKLKASEVIIRLGTETEWVEGEKKVVSIKET
jgi:GAF domain-containing protein/HAMP domain-containing protein